MTLRPLLLSLSLSVSTLPAAAQVANTYCSQNPAACQPVYASPGAGAGYGGGYGAPSYGAGYGGGYGAPSYGAGYGGGYAGAGYGAPGYGAGYGGAGYGAPGYGAGYGGAGYGAPGYGAGYGGGYGAGYGGGYGAPGYGGGGYPPPGYYPNGAQQQIVGALANGRDALPGQFGQGQQAPFPAPDASGGPTTTVPHPDNPDLQRYSAGVFGNVNRPSKVIQKTARIAGIQAGYVEESERIAAYLATPTVTERLEARYPFAEMMLPGGVVPPVISELKHVRQAASTRLVTTTLGAFEILRPARLAIAVPSWRDYLVIPPPSGALDTYAKPKPGEEQANWDVAYKLGLAIGVEQARVAFDDNMDRLTRDLTGMRRFHELAAQGAVSLPVVTVRTAGLKLRKDGRAAAIGERTISLVVAPKFKATTPAAIN